MQSDDLEKASEISKMDAIFSNACIVISAARAARCSQDFLAPLTRPTPGTLSFKLPVACRDGRRGNMILYQVDLDHHSGDPIDQRAWTMQEHMLSRRMLRFGLAGLQWRCKQTHQVYAIEEDLVMDRHLQDLEENTKLSLLLDDPARHVLEWTQIMEEYARRRLKDSTNQLPAMAGMVQRFGKTLGDVYLAGLWLSHLPLGLLWRMDTRSSRPTQYHAPSWAWPSMEPYFLFNNLLDLRPDTALEVHSYSIEPKFESLPYGQINGGSLTLKGRLAPMLLDPVNHNFENADPSIQDYMTPEFIDLSLDSIDVEGSLEPRAVWCLQVALYDEETDSGPAGLVLSQHETEHFQRLGVYLYDRRSFSSFVDDHAQLDKETDHTMRQEQQLGLSRVEPVVIEIR
ncbi:hypothetical protein H2200_010626 [Cladophialophora chaetospira]|uniref:Heterokaryon incompatibility domain-containing protein n=1 Tax=Cladophialophora chaetospira TaxID=386627 RepID=A0AA38X1U2_9EURO|nr:hypothetical protein H2200_010626 [Cladophialophora chaetospira]